MAVFEITITEVRKKKIFVTDVDYDFEAERKIEEDYLNNRIDMNDVDPTSWELTCKEI